MLHVGIPFTRIFLPDLKQTICYAQAHVAKHIHWFVDPLAKYAILKIENSVHGHLLHRKQVQNLTRRKDCLKALVKGSRKGITM